MEVKNILDHIWHQQKSFNRNFVDFDKMDNRSRQEMTKEYVLHVNSELVSLLEEVNWKLHHKKDSINVNRNDLLLEWIDVFKYWLSIGLLWDFTPDEFVKAFDEKSSLVEQRYLQEFSDIEGRDIVVCDIDGILSDYPVTFLENVTIMEAAAGRSVDIDTDNVTNLDLYQYLEGRVSSEDLKYYKHLYRSTGAIRDEKVLEGAREFLHQMKLKGCYIVLLTSRPFDTYKSLYLDTYMWLVRNSLEFDMLLNDSKKRDKITKILQSSRIRFIVDDDPKIVLGLLGIDKLKTIYLMDRPYNRSFDCSLTRNVNRVDSFEEILSREFGDGIND